MNRSQARIATHYIFDWLWKSGHMSRTGAYNWLAGRLHMSPNCCHIAAFGKYKCAEVRRVVEEYLHSSGLTQDYLKRQHAIKELTRHDNKRRF